MTYLEECAFAQLRTSSVIKLRLVSLVLSPNKLDSSETPLRDSAFLVALGVARKSGAAVFARANRFNDLGPSKLQRQTTTKKRTSAIANCL